ncbi:MAG: asparagine synthase (glutamine-hydrolyzing) [Myxococcales bacterium]|nr:MAG: asparagine synthase (glutamine-hydrolyzing) [Myxococcales bacterium]
MCGIAGLWRYDGDRRAAIAAMGAAMAHRGPDDEGDYFADDVALGHRRLSIIDLAGGRQPIGNEDGSIVVVFNGEIYNFRELRDGLIRRGHRFATQSDTETLVHLYEDEGERMVESLNGMFAFALYDAPRRRVLLARDHVGVKPLYVARFGETIAFASELGAIAAVPELAARLSLNPQALFHYTALFYVPDPLTVYTEAEKLPPGCLAIIDDGGLHVRRYWRPRIGEPFGGTFAEAAEELDALVGRAVRRQLVADVPVGAFLSGGVDSSLVVAHMAAAGDARAFTVGFSEADYDERRYARAVAARVGATHAESLMPVEAAKLVYELTPRFGEPFADSSALPTYLVSKATRAHVTVALSGDGGDELFGGYGKYDLVRREAWLRRLPQRLRRDGFRRLAERLPARWRGKNLLRALAMDQEEYALLMLGPLRQATLLCDDVLAACDGEATIDFMRRLAEPPAGIGPLTRLQLIDMQTYLPGDILTKVDRMSMAVSLETRVPLLDKDVVEFAFRLPAHFKRRRGVRKAVLKRALERHLPKSLVHRRKQGFGVPLAEWFRRDLRPLVETELSEASLRAGGVYRPAAVRALLDEHLSGRRNHSANLWQMLAFVIWRRHAAARR